MPSGYSTRLSDSATAIHITWPDGRSARFHAVWLRDHGEDEKTRDPVNGQKLLTATDIAPDLAIDNAAIHLPNLDIRFSDGSTTFLSLDRLRRLGCERENATGLIDDRRTTWDASLDPTGVFESLPRLQTDPAALLRWLGQIERLGFARLGDVPCRPGALLDAIALFGFVRETNYGRTFDVRSAPDPVNLAYTRVGLDPHTDNPYRDPTPTIQVLHCLENSAEGGESSVVDGFRAAEILRREHPDDFALLSRINVTFRYNGDGNSDLCARRPMLELTPGGTLVQVRINNRAFQELTDIAFDEVPAFYAAYRRLVEITRRPEVTVTFRLEPGDLFVVDNTRVLHGRTGFTGAGERWLQGAYADMDGLRSTLSILRNRDAA